MYPLAHFKELDKQKLINFMQQNSFAIITGFAKDFPVATHIPLVMEQKNGKIFLHGHLMKKTDHHIVFEKNNNVLVIFNGPHCYVSASWYSQPQQASTWNYMTVHAKGKIFFTNEEGTYDAVKTITHKYEDEASKAAFNRLPKEYVMPLLKAIIGFTIEVENLDNVFKLSQNRDVESKKNIIAQLKKQDNENALQIATEMENRL